MVVVTHEIRFAQQVADQVLFMDGGVIVERGTPAEVLTAPRTERARQFLHRILDPLWPTDLRRVEVSRARYCPRALTPNREGGALGSAHGCRRHRRGSRPRRPRRRRRARRGRPPRGRARPGERGQPRRPGALVVRRAVPRRQPRAAADGHHATPSTWPGRTGRARPAWTGSTTRTTGPGSGREAYVEWAAGEKRAWLHEQGMRFFPVVGWAERGDGTRQRARQLGAALPHRLGHRARGRRALPAPRARARRRRAGGDPLPPPGRRAGALRRGGHRRRGPLLAPDGAERGRPTNRDVTGEFELAAQAVVVTSGGIGGNHELVRANWPEPPRHAAGAHAHRCPGLRRRPDDAASPRPPAGAVVNRDRMWHYVEGDPQLGPGLAAARHPHPARPELAVVRRRSATGCRPRSSRASTPSARWPTCGRPGTTTRGSSSPSKIIGKEFALSGSEQNPDLTGKSVRDVLGRARSDMPAPVRAFLDHGEDFVHGRHDPRARRQDERARPRRRTSTPPTSSGRSSTATGRSRTPSARTPR